MGLIKSLLQAIMPMRCASCDVSLYDEAGLCHVCWSKIHFISEPICIRCGYPIEFDISENGTDTLCGRCLTSKGHFDSARSVCSYGKIVGKIVGRLKYGDDLHIAKFIARSMLQTFVANYKDATILCPVPIHPSSLRQRMFNQSALIATSIARMLKKEGIHLQYIPDLLCKPKLTKKQNGLTRQQRLDNIKNSFSLNRKYDIRNSKIVILDDVITTCATINECAKTIRKCEKSAKIYAISYARTTFSSIDNEDDLLDMSR